MMRLERPICFHRETTGHKRIRREPAKVSAVEPGKIPRISRLMALAIKFEQMLGNGEATDQSSLARMVDVTQPRMSQIMNLLHLAPDLQETLLFLPRTIKGNDPIHEKMLRPVTLEFNWHRQREMWKTLMNSTSLPE
ncbi:MAG: hypothetical protein NTX48_07245 [Planctomycetales bacterium]|nr:hypothetical protein [Planctomycetales bacterium]